MMRTIFKILFVIAVPALLLVAGLYSARTNMQSRIDRMLAAYGFPHAQTGRFDYRDGYLVYSSIALDPDKFSTISDIQAPAGLPGYLLQKKPQVLVINDLKLTGEFSRESGLEIAGWKKIPLPPPATDRIILKDGQLDVMTSAGALRFEAKGETVKQPDGTAKLQGMVNAAQNQLDAKTLWSGIIYPNGKWAYEINIQEASLNLDKIQGSRMSGWLTLDNSKDIIPVISSQIDAGKLTIGGINLMNFNLTLSGPLNNHTLTGSGHVGGYEDMPFTFDLNNKADGPHLTAAIETPALDDLMSFLNDLQTSDVAGESITTSLLLTPGNLKRLKTELKNVRYDMLELQVYGPLYDLAAKVIAKKFKDGVSQNYVISLDPGTDENNG